MILTVSMKDSEIGTGIIKKLQEAFPEAVVVQCDLINIESFIELLKGKKPLILCNIEKSTFQNAIVGVLLNFNRS
jgi:hypothetical protein